MRSSFSRFSHLVARKRNLIFIFIFHIISFLFLFLNTDNIFENPNLFPVNFKTALRFGPALISVFLNCIVFSEKWAKQIFHEWRVSKGRVVLENILTSIYCTGFSFVTFLVPFLLVTQFLSIETPNIWQISLNNLLFVLHQMVLMVMVSLIPRLHKQTVLILLFNFILFLLAPKILSLVFSISFHHGFIFSFFNIFFPYLFNFSILSETGSFESLLLSFFCCLGFFVLFVKLSNKRGGVIVAIGLSALLMLVVSYGSHYYYRSKLITDNLEPVKKVDVSLIFTGKSIIKNFGMLPDEIRNFHFLNVYLKELLKNGEITSFRVLPEGVVLENQISGSNEIKKSSSHKLDYSFFISINGKRSASLLGKSIEETKQFVNKFILMASGQKRTRIGFSSARRLWDEKGKNKTTLLRNLETIFQFVSLESEAIKSLDDFEMLIIDDRLKKNDGFYSRVFSYIQRGGKVLFFTDGLRIDEKNSFELLKHHSDSDRFLSKLGVSVKRGRYVFPKYQMEMTSSFSEIMENRETLGVECFYPQCKSMFNGGFNKNTQSLKLFTPTYFSINLDNKLFTSSPLLVFNQEHVDIFDIKKSVVTMSELKQGVTFGPKEKITSALKLSSRNKNGGEIILIGDLDILSLNGRGKNDYVTSSFQIIQSSILNLMTNTPFKPSDSPLMILPSTFFDFFGKESESLNMRRKKSLEVKKNKNDYVKNFAMMESAGYLKDEIKSKSDEIKLKINENIREINILTESILDQVFRIRLLIFLIMVGVFSMFFFPVIFLLFFRNRNQRQRIFVY